MNYEFDAGTGLNEDTVRYISKVKKEAPWILEFRLNALKTFFSKPMPTHWATKDLENINFDKIRYYLASGQKPKRTWDEVPDDIKKTFDRLGIPEQERKYLAGVEAQYDSEAAYSNIKDIVAKQGVIFANSTEALREHPEIFRKFFGKVIPTGDNKFSALNSAVFSGGSFIYVPPGVKVCAAAAGLLPHQRREFRAVRAHPHHRRRGFRGRLHGGLHRPEVQHLDAPQRRGRARRPQGSQDPIHHGPELGQQRVQPRDQARRRPRGTPRSSGSTATSGAASP